MIPGANVFQYIYASLTEYLLIYMGTYKNSQIKTNKFKTTTTTTTTINYIFIKNQQTIQKRFA